MKRPDEEKLTKLYGQNEAKKKSYRRGWYTVGKTLEKQRNEKSMQKKSSS